MQHASLYMIQGGSKVMRVASNTSCDPFIWKILQNKPSSLSRLHIYAKLLNKRVAEVNVFNPHDFRGQCKQLSVIFWPAFLGQRTFPQELAIFFDRKPWYSRGQRNMFKIVICSLKYVRAFFLNAFLDQITFPQEPLIFFDREIFYDACLFWGI